MKQITIRKTYVNIKYEYRSNTKMATVILQRG